MPDNAVTIVSGLPRSGTSLMMQILQAGGLPLLADDLRPPDESNPRGYFELQAVKDSRHDYSWLDLAIGKAVKVIHLLLPSLPANRPYHVIFMLRNLEEVVASQRTMLRQQGRPAAALADEKLAALFEMQLATVGHWLSQRPNFRVLYLNHSEVIADPFGSATKINHFLGGNLSVLPMAQAVNPQLYRQRKPLPTANNPAAFLK